MSRRRGGIKLRDAANRRLGRLDKQYGAICNEYYITFTYEGKDGKEKAVGTEWRRKKDYVEQS